MIQSRNVSVHMGAQVGSYGFGDDHPLSNQRMHAFSDELHRRQLDYQVRIVAPVAATEDELLLFHDQHYIERVRKASELGEGMLDYGDTPAYQGVFEDAGCVVGTTLDATRRLMSGEVRRAFVPIAGLHHARPDTAAGFCVFNDCGVAIRLLQQDYKLERIAYVDIDAHHGDGVYYPFEDDPTVIFADIHEDGRYNYPQSGFQHETGRGQAKGRKLNIPLLPGAGDDDFVMMWKQVEEFLDRWEPEFIMFQSGADGLKGDPLAHLHFSAYVHQRAARDLCKLAERHAHGRILALGGGGYDLHNLGKAWASVVETFVTAPA